MNLELRLYAQNPLFSNEVADAYRMLGETEIPAIVIDAAENDCLVMSLVENIARRQRRPLDIMQEIGSLHDRGYSDTEIAEKIGCTASWINMIATLLSRGEERLVSAVETGLIPLMAEGLDISSYTLKRLLNHKDMRDVTAGYIVLNVERLRVPMQRIAMFILRVSRREETAKILDIGSAVKER
jgi:hypothetical protein